MTLFRGEGEQVGAYGLTPQEIQGLIIASGGDFTFLASTLNQYIEDGRLTNAQAANVRSYARQSGYYPFGLPLKELQGLVREAGGNFQTLESWLNAYIERGTVTREQAANIYDYTTQSYEASQEVDLPFGSSFEEIKQRYQQRGKPAPEEQFNWLALGWEMEQAEVQRQKDVAKGVIKAGIISKDPKEQISLKEELARSRRFGVKYQAYVRGQLGENIPGINDLTPEQIAAFEPQDIYGQTLQGRAAEVAAKEAAALRRGGFRREREGEPRVTPFTPPRLGDVAGTLSWQNWFARKYGGIVGKFYAQPKRTQVGWERLLREETLAEREEFTKQSPYARGERPSAYAPPLRTITF